MKYLIMQESKKMENEPTNEILTEPTQTPTNANINSQKPPPASLLDVEISDEVVALNVLISFLQLANKRGTFNLEEAAKIWECVKKFKRQG